MEGQDKKREVARPWLLIVEFLSIHTVNTFVFVRLRLNRSNLIDTLFILSVRKSESNKFDFILSITKSESNKFDVSRQNFETNTSILFDQLLLILNIWKTKISLKKEKIKISIKICTCLILIQWSLVTDDDQEQRIQLLRSCTNHPSSTYRVHASTHLKVVYKNKTQSTSKTISITCKQHT